MKRSSALTGCLALIVGLLLAEIVLLSVFPDAVDGSMLLKLLVGPLQFLGPWIIPIPIAWLFGRLGCSTRPARRIARILSGIAASLLIMFLSFMVAMAGRLVVPVGADASVSGILLAAALAFGVYGFRRDRVETT
jgi:hypothetical protein